MKKILIATGSSDNKKAFAMDYVQKYVDAKGVAAEVVAANIYDMDLASIAPSVIVTIGPANFKTDIPVIAGTAFLTKMGMDAVCDQIIAAIQ